MHWRAPEFGGQTKVKVKVLDTRSCPTLCDPLACSLPGSSVHGILQARILEWVAIPFSRGPSQPRDWTQVSCIAGRFFTVWATRENWIQILALSFMTWGPRQAVESLYTSQFPLIICACFEDEMKGNMCMVHILAQSGFSVHGISLSCASLFWGNGVFEICFNIWILSVKFSNLCWNKKKKKKRKITWADLWPEMKASVKSIHKP